MQKSDGSIQELNKWLQQSSQWKNASLSED